MLVYSCCDLYCSHTAQGKTTDNYCSYGLHLQLFTSSNIWPNSDIMKLKPDFFPFFPLFPSFFASKTSTKTANKIKTVNNLIQFICFKNDYFGSNDFLFLKRNIFNGLVVMIISFLLYGHKLKDTEYI